MAMRASLSHLFCRQGTRLMTCTDIRSRMIVISWWSNCLGLACLYRLVEFAPQREIDYVQVGKTQASRDRFRSLAPAQARELFYPEQAPAEHSRVLQAVALGQMHDECGVWFFDHDLLMQAEMGGWLDVADDLLSQTRTCLCFPARAGSQAITQPLFWLSPARWPDGIAGFDPVPYHAHPVSLRPDLVRHSGVMHMPVKDTLVKACEELAEKGLVEYFPLRSGADAGGKPFPLRLPSLPAHMHLGGLSLLAGPLLPASFTDWMHNTVARFRAFFDACPPAWIRSEDPELLARLRQYEGGLHA